MVITDETHSNPLIRNQSANQYRQVYYQEAKMNLVFACVTVVVIDKYIYQ